MMYTGQTIGQLEQGPVVIRALHSLTHSDATRVGQALQTVAPDWQIAEHDDYNGYLSVLISKGDDDAEGRSFLISGLVDRVELAELRDDKLVQLAPIGPLEQAITKLISIVAPGS